MEATIVDRNNKKSVLALIFFVLALVCGVATVIQLTRLFTHTNKTSTAFFNSSKQKISDAIVSISTLLKDGDSYFESLQEKIAQPGTSSGVEQMLKNRPSFLSAALVQQRNGTQALSIEVNDTKEYKVLDNSFDISYLKKITPSADFVLIPEPYTQTPSLMRVQKVNHDLIAIGINIHHIDHILRTLYLDQSGYWFLTDEKGTLITHPNNQYVAHESTIADIAKQTNTQDLSSQFDQRSDSDSIYADYNNEITGAPSRAFMQKIPHTPLTLVGIFDLNEADLNVDFIRKQQLLLWWWLALTLLFLTLAWLCYKTNIIPSDLWYASCAITCILLLAIGACWFTCLHYPYMKPDDAQITSKKQLYKTLQELSRWKNNNTQQNTLDPLSFRYKEGKYIPTGILINDISFQDNDKIEFVGYMWQRYFDGIHDGIQRGFIFPQIADKPTMTEIHRSKQGKTETIIWQVCTQLNQDFNYERYPFDVENITIAVRHKEFDKNVTLVPDLDAYTIINPTSLPGINKTTHINNWDLLKSYFGYDFQQYATNFGLYLYGPFGTYSRSEQSDVAELRFNVITQRYLLDTIVTDLLALCVIAVILFVLLLTYFSDGVNIVLSTAATAFFSTVFAQIQFRSKVPTHQFVYFEIFYFVLYAAIILILISTLIHLYHLKFRSINYHNNIITKVLYWPCISMTLLACTVWFLY